MKKVKTSALLMLFMVFASFASMFLEPHNKLSERSGTIQLASMVPSRFAGWQEVEQQNALLVDPQQADTLSRIYTQTLSRTYVNQSGYSVMLSIAYGDDQSDGVELHYPEVCYPAQGFIVFDKQKGILETDFGSLPITRLVTALRQRTEPVTYWATVGNNIVSGKIDKKLTEMQYGFRGLIPDGLLFRVSSIDPDSIHAFTLHEQFVQDLLLSLDPQPRSRLAGISP